MKIKKKFIKPILLMLLSFDAKTQQPVTGILIEEMGLGLKRKVQKIRNELLKHSEELEADGNEISEKLKDKPDEIQKEFEELLNEEITLTSEPALISEIEKIQTKCNYDFELIEMIAV